jgi:hypothetical protein
MGLNTVPDEPDEDDYAYRDPAVPLTEDQLLLRKKVLHQVETEPETFYMGDWEREGSCGTTRCIAGWAQFLARGQVCYFGNEQGLPDVEEDAIELLGLTENEYAGDPAAGSGLFYTSNDEALQQLRELAKG